MLTIKKASLSFGATPLIHNFSIDIPAGQITLITAPSGCGKSTLLSWISGTQPANLKATGTIYLDDIAVHNLPVEKRHIGMIYQDPLMFPHLTVAGNLAFGLSRDVKGAARSDMIKNTLCAIGMDGLGPQDAMTLSGGQKARLSLMRSLLARPKALLLDEPFSGLDGNTRNDVAKLVKDEIKARGLPALMVSHDPRDHDYADNPAIALEAYAPA